MKILKHGKYYHPPQLCICPKCGCEFVVDDDKCGILTLMIFTDASVLNVIQEVLLWRNTMIKIIKNGTDCVTKLFHQDGSIVSFECRMCGCIFETDIYSIRAFSNPVYRESVCPQCLSTTKKLGAIG